MIIAFWCVLVAALLPIVCSYMAKFGARSEGGGGSARFDNHEPRAWLARQTGMRARANAAQLNSFEAFPFFAAGVVIAVLQHIPVPTIDACAMVFIVARIAYIAFYLADLASLRSASYVVGFGSCIGLFLFAASGTLR